ncbi:YaaR family protein [Alkaliphilus transvaalensis]|uniref:YaaR family protein n=1 Tax=Alkaliphilus transvaalensis TaxID=114628 RepID=UPI00047CF645|nr:YaaR family protein [Alkaliphilus transvaalensis]
MNRIDHLSPVDYKDLMKAPTNKVEKNKENFIAKFQEIKSDQVREHLQGLYEKIVSQSERIGDKLHLSEVIKYKTLVREFLDVATKNSHQFSKQNFLDRRGRHRVYSIVKSVDRELDQLTKEFLKDEKDRISIIKRLDDIRGMLLDVMM